MKKYFLFDDEPISGTNYVRRIMVGSVLMLLLIGFWILAATGYKRAGTFGWKKEYRIIAAILIPILGIGNTLAKGKGYNDSPFNLFDIFVLLAVCFHTVMLFKNGNKNSRELITNNNSNELEEKLINVKIKVGYIDNELHYQLKGNLVNPEEKLMLSQNLKFRLLFEDEMGNHIVADELPTKLFNENSNFYIKSGIITYESHRKIPHQNFSRIAKCTIECSD
jgi:hypothetical protein